MPAALVNRPMQICSAPLTHFITTFFLYLRSQFGTTPARMNGFIPAQIVQVGIRTGLATHCSQFKQD